MAAASFQTGLWDKSVTAAHVEAVVGFCALHPGAPLAVSSDGVIGTVDMEYVRARGIAVDNDDAGRRHGSSRHEIGRLIPNRFDG